MSTCRPAPGGPLREQWPPLARQASGVGFSAPQRLGGRSGILARGAAPAPPRRLRQQRVSQRPSDGGSCQPAGRGLRPGGSERRSPGSRAVPSWPPRPAPERSVASPQQAGGRDPSLLLALRGARAHPGPRSRRRRLPGAAGRRRSGGPRPAASEAPPAASGDGLAPPAAPPPRAAWRRRGLSPQAGPGRLASPAVTSAWLAAPGGRGGSGAGTCPGAPPPRPRVLRGSGAR